MPSDYDQTAEICDSFLVVDERSHDGWNIEVRQVRGVERADQHPYFVAAFGPRMTFVRGRFSRELSALAYAVTRIDCGDWK